MRKNYEKALQDIHQELIKMGSLCEESIEIACTLLFNSNDEKLQKVSELEKQIDQHQHLIEKLCMRLLLLEQPLAGDFKRVSNALKMISDMERIGDQALDIASLPAFPGLSLQTHIDDMCAMCGLMLESAIKAFIQNDLYLANEVVKMDDIVDGLFTKVKEEAIDIIHNRPEQAFDVLNLLMASKYLERIGDHSVNIAECMLR